MWFDTRMWFECGLTQTSILRIYGHRKVAMGKTVSPRPEALPPVRAVWVIGETDGDPYRA